MGCIRLNKDGSCREDVHIGYVGIIRGSDDEWISGFAKSVGHENTFLVKLCGMVEGLKYARKMNLCCVELHVDSLVVVKVITSRCNGSVRGRALVDKKIRLIELDWKVLVKHTYREVNQCTNALANIGCNMVNDCIYFDVCPSQIRHLFLADVGGITTPRMIQL